MISLVGNIKMPVISIDSIGAVPTALLTLHRRSSTSSTGPQPADPARSLLPYCSTRHTLSEDAVSRLTHVTSDLRDLVDKMSNPIHRKLFEDYLGEEVEGIMSFWTTDRLID